MHVHMLMKADLRDFNALSSDSAIYTGTCSEGEAVLLPPGFIFCDLAFYSGMCGLKLTFAHRGCLDSLKVLKQDATIFAASNGDSSQTAIMDLARSRAPTPRDALARARQNRTAKRPASEQTCSGRNRHAPGRDGPAPSVGERSATPAHPPSSRA